MKKALKIILPIVLVLALLISAVWYFVEYDRDFTRDTMLYFARVLDDHGNRTLSNKIYDLAYRYAKNDDAIAIELARQYREYGNYTKAEYTLSNAIADGASVDLYIALCQTYVEQDKLLDAVTMLDTISDPAIKAQIEELRPTVPKADPYQGHYNNYITVSLSAPDSKIYYTLNSEYPSTTGQYTAGLVLPGGQTTIRAVSINAQGLVSPLTVMDYTVAGVIEPLQLKDPAIERAIRQQLMVDENHILYTNELWTIEFFSVPEDATSLDDLAKMPFLTQLSISEGNLGRLASLSQLVTLKELIITDKILTDEDMQAIGTLTELEQLTLKNCSITSIATLSGMEKLVYLDLSRNTIRDLSVVGNMPKLQYLDLSHNAVTELAALSGLTEMGELNISYNSVATLEPIGTCTALHTVNADHNLLTSLFGLQTLSGLRSLSVAFNQLTDVSSLSGNPLLGVLEISNNKISDISALAELKELMTLNFSFNEVKKLPAFTSECKLMTIKGSRNQLSSLDELAVLQELNYIQMDHNANISSVAKLTGCYSLVEISIYGTKVKDVSMLEKLDIIVKYSPL